MSNVSAVLSLWPLAVLVVIGFVFWRFFYRPARDYRRLREHEVSQWSHDELEHRSSLALRVLYGELRTQMDRYAPRGMILRELQALDDELDWDEFDLEAVTARLDVCDLIRFAPDSRGHTVSKDRLLLTAKGARKAEHAMGHDTSDPDPRIPIHIENSQFLFNSPGARQEQTTVTPGVPPEVVTVGLQVIDAIVLALRSGQLNVQDPSALLGVAADAESALKDPKPSKGRIRKTLTAMLVLVGGAAKTAVSDEITENLKMVMDELAKLP